MIGWNTLTFERFYPYIFGLLASTFWFELGLSMPEKDSIYSSTLTVAGILVGFLATSKAILLSMESRILTDLRESGYILDLVAYIGQAIWVNLTFCVINVSSYFDFDKSAWFGVIWIGIAVCALLSFIRVTHIMLQIFKQNS